MTSAAILIDFDNIFITLWQVDSDLAQRFATQPLKWLSALANEVIPPRRWLVARLYLNPNGWVATGDPDQPRLYFSRFRPGLVRAGFEVVDCPSLSRDKNAADIRIVIDALDLLEGPSRYEEFVIGSGDSDFTPLLRRLRAHDRRTALVAPGVSATALLSLADTYIDFERFEQLVRPESDTPSVDGEPEGVFEAFVRDRYAEAASPLNLSSLASEVALAVPGARESDWFGSGSFTAALAQLGLPHARFSQHHLHDDSRHPPAESATVDPASALAPVPGIVGLLQREQDLPRLPSHLWPPAFAMLARYAAEHDFNLTEATRWTRDELALAGTPVGRPALGYIVRGAEFGGATLARKPSPPAQDIASAFYRNLLARARAGSLAVTAEDERQLADWLGLAPPTGDEPGSASL